MLGQSTQKDSHTALCRAGFPSDSACFSCTRANLHPKTKKIRKASFKVEKACDLMKSKWEVDADKSREKKPKPKISAPLLCLKQLG